MLYLDAQPIIQSIFQGIPIGSCSTTHQIQTAACYDVFTLTTSRCITIESTVAAVAVVLTQCITTTDIITRPRFWNSQLSRGGLGGVGRISAQLLTYVTGEPIYAPTIDAQTTSAPTNLPLSEARIAAIPASTWDAINGLPVETQAASTTNGDIPAARILDGGDRAYSSSVRGHVLVISDPQSPQDVPQTTRTEHYLGSPNLPKTSPQLEHVDVLKIVSAIQEVASGLQSSHQRPQETESRPANIEPSNFALTNAESTNEDDGTDDSPPTAKHNGHVGMTLSSDVASTAFGPSQENDHDTSTRSKLAMVADSALQSLSMQEPLPTTPTPTTPSTSMQTETLTPGDMLVFGKAHLSVLPDASGLTLSDGSTVRLKDGEIAEIRLLDDTTVRFSRSGTVYFAETRTADTTQQLSGSSDSARTTEQITGGGSGLSRSIAEVSTGVATDGFTKGVAAEASAGAALAYISDARGIVVGVLVVLALLTGG